MATTAQTDMTQPTTPSTSPVLAASAINYFNTGIDASKSTSARRGCLAIYVATPTDKVLF